MRDSRRKPARIVPAVTAERIARDKLDKRGRQSQVRDRAAFLLPSTVAEGAGSGQPQTATRGDTACWSHRKTSGRWSCVVNFWSTSGSSGNLGRVDGDGF